MINSWFAEYEDFLSPLSSLTVKLGRYSTPAKPNLNKCINTLYNPNRITFSLPSKLSQLYHQQFNYFSFDTDFVLNGKVQAWMSCSNTLRIWHSYAGVAKNSKSVFVWGKLILAVISGDPGGQWSVIVELWSNGDKNIGVMITGQAENVQCLVV